VQQLLEYNPGLVFRGGQIQHRVYAPPSPPPPPEPPPSTLSDQGRTNFPPPSPNPPPPPPPWYRGAGECQPIITQAAAGIENPQTIDQSQERAVCVYVRRILDMRLPAETCFDTMPPSPPPPPPLDDALAANRRINDEHQQIDQGILPGTAERPAFSQKSELQAERIGSLDFAAQTIKDLSTRNLQLQPLLASALEKIQGQLREERIAAGIDVYGAEATQTGISYNQPSEVTTGGSDPTRVQDFGSSTVGVHEDTTALNPDYHGRDAQNAGGGRLESSFTYQPISTMPRKYVQNAHGPGTGRRLAEDAAEDAADGGRRLFEQDWGVRDARLDANLVLHPIMEAGPLRGITVAECSAICEALRRNSTDSSGVEECQAFAYRRRTPKSLQDFTVERCYFLRDSGSCAAIDFAARIYSRKRVLRLRTRKGCRRLVCARAQVRRQPRLRRPHARARPPALHGAVGAAHRGARPRRRRVARLVREQRERQGPAPDAALQAGGNECALDFTPTRFLPFC
jgi:hypothetical protein